MKISSTYFNLIRHPEVGAKKHGKFLTGLAWVSLFFVIPPLGFGIAYLIGRITRDHKDPKVAQLAADRLPLPKEIQANPPIGIPNFGNSCWTAAGMQAFLSCESLHELAKRELKLGVSADKVQLENGNWVVVDRPESLEEFHKRQKVQSSLIEFLDMYQKRDPKLFKNALIRFQEAIRDADATLGTVEVKGRNDARNLFIALEHVYPELIRVTGLSISQMKNPYEEVLKGNSRILILQSSDENLKAWDVDAILELPQAGKYRLASLTISTGTHAFAYVRRGNEWYDCNDKRVKKIPLKTIPLDGQSRLVFESVLVKN